MADILLIGPQRAGKTQLFHSLCGKEYADPHQTDEYDYKAKNFGFWGKIGFSHFSIHEVGGKDKFYTDLNFLENVIRESEKIVFVFDGNDFIDELKNFQKGGYISSMLRCYVIPALEKCNKEKSICFVATHADEYCGVKDDMNTEIISSLEHANEEYRKIAHSTRYPFKTLMHGNLFCTDARDFQQH